VTKFKIVTIKELGGKATFSLIAFSDGTPKDEESFSTVLNEISKLIDENGGLKRWEISMCSHTPALTPSSEDDPFKILFEKSKTGGGVIYLGEWVPINLKWAGLTEFFCAHRPRPQPQRRRRCPSITTV
jgi:hypothetical protein